MSKLNGGYQTVNVSIKSIGKDLNLPPMLMIAFHDVEAKPAQAAKARPGTGCSRKEPGFTTGTRSEGFSGKSANGR